MRGAPNWQRLLAATPAARAGGEKVETGFPLKSCSKPLGFITFYDFGSSRSKIIVI
jgi:hypothetical protein